MLATGKEAGEKAGKEDGKEYARPRLNIVNFSRAVLSCMDCRRVPAEQAECCSDGRAISPCAAASARGPRWCGGRWGCSWPPGFQLRPRRAPRQPRPWSQPCHRCRHSAGQQGTRRRSSCLQGGREALLLICPCIGGHVCPEVCSRARSAHRGWQGAGLHKSTCPQSRWHPAEGRQHKQGSTAVDCCSTARGSGAPQPAMPVQGGPHLDDAHRHNVPAHIQGVASRGRESAGGTQRKEIGRQRNWRLCPQTNLHVCNAMLQTDGGKAHDGPAGAGRAAARMGSRRGQRQQAPRCPPLLVCQAKCPPSSLSPCSSPSSLCPCSSSSPCASPPHTSLTYRFPGSCRRRRGQHWPARPLGKPACWR